jgi:hypothetical protein
MPLISYDQFAKLRLRDFVPDGTAIAQVSDWEWMGSCWYNEGVGFTSFSRHVSTPDLTGGLEISFTELPDDSNQRLLSAIGLPLCPGMNTTDVLSVMGLPAETHQFVPDRRSYEFTAGDSQPYVVSCTVHESEGLIHVAVVRPDLLHRDE